MGYSTNYTVEVTPRHYKALEAIIAMSEYGCSWDEQLHSIELTDAKWYKWEDHMVAISRANPDHIFHLHGEGEESGDLWEAWFYNGKVEIVNAVIEFPAPDWVKSALKEVVLKEKERLLDDAARVIEEEKALLAKLKEKYPDA